MREKLLFIDFNGVISYDPFWSSLFHKDHPSHDWSGHIHEFLFTGKNDLVNQWMYGRLKLEDICHKLEIHLGLPYQELLRIFIQDIKVLDFSKKILDILKLLKETHYIILMTDNMETLEKYLMPAQTENFSVFDSVENSFHLGFRKRDNDCQYFVDILDRYGVDQKCAVFIDDGQKNCDAFLKSLPQAKAFCTKGENEAIETLRALL